MENTKARAKRLRDYYNLTIEQWDAIEAYQHGVCWLCGRKEPTGKRLATDHSHLDGLIRGLLCSQCNPLLGKLENAFVRLGLHKVPGVTLLSIVEKLVSYLTTAPATLALGMSVFGYPGRTGTHKHRAYLRKQSKAVRVSKPFIAAQKAHK